MLYLLSFCLSLLLSLSLLSPSSVNGRLVNVQLISRHGIRAPNPVVIQLCPRNAINIKKYDQMSVDSGGLTGKGMIELYMLGLYTRKQYINSGFISPNYRENEIFVQAVAEDRTMQSAVAWGQALFPPGSAPSDFFNGLPEPLPIYSYPDKKDNLLEARKGICGKKLKQDSNIWDNGYGQHVWNEMQETIDNIGRLCGVNMNEIWKGSGDNYGDAIKDISDNLWFDQLSGFTPLEGLTLPLFSSLRELAVRQLLGRILGTPQQSVYLNGDLPQKLVNNWRETLDGGQKLFAYHGHREMMYALASFFELDFNIPFPGLPHGGILPGGTVFIELHSNGPHQKPISAPAGSKWYSVLSGDEHFIIRAYLWYPCYNTTGANGNQLIMGPLDPESNCPSHPIKIAGCKEYDCPLPTVLNFIQNKIEKVGGDWTALCAINNNNNNNNQPHQFVDQLSVAESNNNNNNNQGVVTSSLFSFGFIFSLLLVGSIVLIACAKKNHHTTNIVSETIGIDGQLHPQENTQLLP